MVGSMIPAGVQPQASQICAEVVKYNPGKVRNVWGYNTTPDHNNRRCVDYMIFDKAGGDQVVKYHLDEKQRLLVDLIIWNRRIIRSYDKPGIPKWTWATYYGEDPHTDHPHVQYKVGAYVPPDGEVKPPPSISVKVNDTAIVLANGALNGRDKPNGTVKTTRPYGDTFVVKAVDGSWASDGTNWFAGQYLVAMVKPDPKNTAGIKKGDRVQVTANGGLIARILPGGPISKVGDKNLVRPTGYEFKVTGDPKSGWITGGSNWYSSDYLKKVSVTPPPAAKPSWGDKPKVILSVKDMPNPVSLLQDICRVEPVKSDAGSWAECYIMAQAINGDKDTRFILFDSSGRYAKSWMIVKGGGHGSSFHAYRSAAGNLYVWTWIKEKGYRIKWQGGKTVTSGTLMDYKGGRPMGTYEPYIAFRRASSTHETFSIHSRFGWTDPKNNSKAPIHEVTVKKRGTHTQQTTAATTTRIYRLQGKTNDNPGAGSMRHILDVLDWSGKLIKTVDLTDMMIPSTSDEPEGLSFTGRPGNVLAGKREGGSKPNRSYPIWQLTGLP